jgi:hypothetical protein
MSQHIPTLEQLKRAAQIAEQIAKLEAELQAVLGGAKTRGRKPGKATKSAKATEGSKPEKKSRKKRARNMTPEARARIAEAQKARWAKFRKDQKA